MGTLCTYGSRAVALTLLLIGSVSWAEMAPLIQTIAGTGQIEDGGDRGAALEVNIGNPYGVEIGPDGALYICEVSNHRVRRLDLLSGELTTVAGTGKQGYAGDGGLATAALLNEPYEVRFGCGWEYVLCRDAKPFGAAGGSGERGHLDRGRLWRVGLWWRRRSCRGSEDESAA